MTTKIIVVGLDGSEASRLAFHRAVEEAQFRGGEVNAVHVFGAPLTTGYEMVTLDVDAMRVRAKEFVDREIELLAGNYEVDFPVPVHSEIRIGHTGNELIRAGRDADMMVLGSRGYGGFRGLLVGSVTTFLIHHLPCPVLVVPAPEETS